MFLSLKSDGIQTFPSVAAPAAGNAFNDMKEVSEPVAANQGKSMQLSLGWEVLLKGGKYSGGGKIMLYGFTGDLEFVRGYPISENYTKTSATATVSGTATTKIQPLYKIPNMQSGRYVLPKLLCNVGNEA